MTSYQVIVSKPGVDVKTAADKDKIFDSNLNTLKIAVEGSFYVTCANGTGSTGVAHNLGYIPSYLFFIEVPTGSGKWHPALGYRWESQDTSWHGRIDENNLTVDMTDNSGADDRLYAVRYFIFVNDG